jgi:hypothetical protein
LSKECTTTSTVFKRISPVNHAAVVDQKYLSRLQQQGLAELVGSTEFVKESKRLSVFII